MEVSLWKRRRTGKAVGQRYYTVRDVSINRLSNIPAWRERQKFLQDKMYDLEWRCLIPKDTGFFDFCQVLLQHYGTFYIGIRNVFVREVSRIPLEDWGAKEFLDSQQDLWSFESFDLPGLMRGLIVHQAPCLCPTKHEDFRELPRGLYTLPLLAYLKEWLVDEYLRIVAEVSSEMDDSDGSTYLEESTALTPESRLKNIAIRLLETIHMNMAKVVKEGLKAIPKHEPTTWYQ